MAKPFIFKNDLFKGKVAVITGGASGIGLGTAHRLAMAGMDIAIASRRIELCQEKADELAKAYGIKTYAVALDVRDSSSVNAMFREVKEAMGRIDLLVNNAAGNFYFPAKKLRDKLWHAVIDIDLNGTFYCSRAAYKYLKEQGGSIVNISMTLQQTGWVGMAPATAAKAGIDALTKTLALEWAPDDIRVNAVAPGPIVTEGVSKAFEAGGQFADQSAGIPLGKTGDVDDIGDMIVYLTSEAGSWITGEVVVVDGGHSLSPNRMGILPHELDEMFANRKKK